MHVEKVTGRDGGSVAFWERSVPVGIMGNNTGATKAASEDQVGLTRKGLSDATDI